MLWVKMELQRTYYLYVYKVYGNQTWERLKVNAIFNTKHCGLNYVITGRMRIAKRDFDPWCLVLKILLTFNLPHPISVDFRLYTCRLYTCRLYTCILYTCRLYTCRLYTRRLYTRRLYTHRLGPKGLRGRRHFTKFHIGKLPHEQFQTAMMITSIHKLPNHPFEGNVT